MRAALMLREMTTTSTTSVDERTTALTLAARSQTDPRTALRAMREGPDAIGVLVVRERLRSAMREMGLPIPEAR
ncbi:MAG TPA: hypothetical protein VHS09_00820 [Polyangiaceae bacterium]|nr:hypothetical protein [Polyangiaceae bacterium]